MSLDKNSAPSPDRIVIERRYRATAEELWELWTTKDGLESWWGPQGFRIAVSHLDARVGGGLHYDMIAADPAMIAAMEASGEPVSHKTTGVFTELTPYSRLVINHLIDFLPGVPPYDSLAEVDFHVEGDHVRMVISLTPMHNAEFTAMAGEGWASQLTKLDTRFGAAS